MSAVNSLIDEMLNLYRNTAATPFTAYVALFDGDPEGAGTEITNTIKGSATRDLAGFAAPADAGGNRRIENAAEIEITSSAAAGATADYYAIYDAATGGNLKDSGLLDSAITINSGSPVTIAAGALTVTISPQ